jgi:prepilin-type processing-associated H-X9-DG protein
MIGEAIPAHQRHNSWAVYFRSQVATCAVPLNDGTAAKLACGSPSTTREQDRVACRHNANVNYGFASRHSGGGQFALADGSVRFVPEQVDLAVYRSIGTCSGGEVVSLP